METEHDTNAEAFARDMVTCSLGIKFVGAETRTLDVVASTDRVDSHGEVVIQDDWRLERVQSVGVPVFYNHRSNELPIGKVTQANVVDGRLQASLQLATEDVSADAERVWRAVKGGLIGAVSVGFVPGSFAIKERDGKKVLTIGNPELVEISLTATPANSDTAILRIRSKMIEQRIQTPLESTQSEEQHMKSLLIELGLAETASEAEAIKSVKAIATRADRAEQTMQRFLSATGQSDFGAAIGVAEAWKADASRAKALGEELAAMQLAQKTAEVDAMLAAAQKDRKIKEEEVPFLRKRGIEDPAELKGYLATKGSYTPASVREPAREGSPSASAKKLSDLKLQAQADLYLNDPAEYARLKAVG